MKMPKSNEGLAKFVQYYGKTPLYKLFPKFTIFYFGGLFIMVAFAIYLVLTK